MSAKPTDALARFRQAALHERPAKASTPEKPPEVESAPKSQRERGSRRSTGVSLATEGFEIEERGGRRKVFYLPPDVVQWLEQLQQAADAEGGRLTQSGIITQLVRRHRARG